MINDPDAPIDERLERELIEARNLFVEEYASTLLATDMLLVFTELSEPTPILQSLYACSLPALIDLQLNFHQLMRHEARTMAMRRWTAAEAAFAILRLRGNR